MLLISNIRQNSGEIIERLKLRGIDAEQKINEILKLDEESRQFRTKMEQNQAESNSISAEVAKLYKEGNREKADQLKIRATELKEEIKVLEGLVSEKEESLKNEIVTLPNTPNISVPLGKSAEDNLTILTHGSAIQLHENAKPHWELASKYGIIDFDLGVKITGAGFPVYKGKGAVLQRALIQFFLNEANAAGYTEIQPPLMVNSDSGFGTGQLPDKEGQMYYINEDQLYLIPTAEVPITNIYRNVILQESELPIKNCGYTPCFRREAGSYGAHVRGLNRLHQFDKVEIVQIVKPENSYEVLESMQSYVQSLLQKLGLHYRVLLLCGGDMGFTSAKTYDMEVWSPAQGMWLECSSVSNFENFQTNRLKCRYRNSEGKTELAHSLNGSALALPRIVAAILETYQTPDGIVVPEVLRKYTGFDLITKK